MGPVRKGKAIAPKFEYDHALPPIPTLRVRRAGNIRCSPNNKTWSPRAINQRRSPPPQLQLGEVFSRTKTLRSAATVLVEMLSYTTDSSTTARECTASQDWSHVTHLQAN